MIRFLWSIIDLRRALRWVRGEHRDDERVIEQRLSLQSQCHAPPASRSSAEAMSVTFSASTSWRSFAMEHRESMKPRVKSSVSSSARAE